MFAFDRKINEFFEVACEHWTINFCFHIGYLKIYRLKHARKHTHTHTHTHIYIYTCLLLYMHGCKYLSVSQQINTQHSVNMLEKSVLIECADSVC
jgi:hypothetical protein